VIASDHVKVFGSGVRVYDLPLVVTSLESSSGAGGRRIIVERKILGPR
jgi:hypothetical protein